MLQAAREIKEIKEVALFKQPLLLFGIFILQCIVKNIRHAFA